MANRKTPIARTATEALKILWKESFFRKWKKHADIVDHLAERDHHFSGPELGMALGRAVYLTRRGNRGNYEYIQKHPYAEEEPRPKATRKT
jgi:hypothetical protein